MKTFLMLSAVVVCLAGCGPNPEGTMGGGEPSPAWEGLDEFEQGPLYSAALAAEMGDISGAQREIGSEAFAQSLDTFEQSDVPEAYSDRQAAKDDMVQKFREAIDAAGTADFEAKFDAAMQSMREVRGVSDDE